MEQNDSFKLLAPYLKATHKQHFVKRKYLSQWSTDNKRILAKRKNDIQYKLISLRDVCFSKDIYTISHHFNYVEMFIVKNTYSHCDPSLREEFDENLKLRQLITSPSFANLVKDPQMRDKLVEGFQAQTGENRQTRVEESFFGIIEKYVLNYDDSFLNDPELRSCFFVGLFTQYFRTKKIKDMMVESFDLIADAFKKNNNITDADLVIDHESIWQAVLEIQPRIAAFQLEKIKHGLLFIKSDNKFLTNDNPVIQIGEIDNNGKPKTFKCLYPVSPSLCIICSSSSEIKDGTNDEISRINSIIEDNSDLFIFKK